MKLPKANAVCSFKPVRSNYKGVYKFGRYSVKQYCRFGNVSENLIFTNICEFVALQILNFSTPIFRQLLK